MSGELEVLNRIPETLTMILKGLFIVVTLMCFSAAYKLATIYLFADPKEPKE